MYSVHAPPTDLCILNIILLRSTESAWSKGRRRPSKWGGIGHDVYILISNECGYNVPLRVAKKPCVGLKAISQDDWDRRRLLTNV